MPLIAKLLLASGERRRLLLAASTYSALLDAASIALHAPHAEISLTFSDSDGDMCCIGSDEEFALHGNVYVMNDKGDTIDRFGSAPLPESDFPMSA